MNFLSIESITRNPSISLFLDNSCIDTRKIQNNSSQLPEIINKLISDNKIDINILDYIAVTIGPGSYTGIRVALSLSQGIAYSLGIPLVPINTMDILHFISLSKGNNERIVGFPAYDNNLLYFIINPEIEKIYHIKLKKIESFKAKTVYGIGLSKYRDIINYKKLDFSSIVIGEYSIRNYKSLVSKDIGSITPVYIDQYQIDMNS